MAFGKPNAFFWILFLFVIVISGLKNNFYTREMNSSPQNNFRLTNSTSSGVLQCASVCSLQECGEFYFRNTECRVNISHPTSNPTWQHWRNKAQLSIPHNAVHEGDEGTTGHRPRSVLFSACSPRGCKLHKYQNETSTRLPINGIRNMRALTYVFPSKTLIFATHKPYRIYRYDGRSNVIIRNNTHCLGLDTDQQANLVFISVKNKNINTHGIARMDADGENFTHIYSGRHPVVSFTLHPLDKLIFAVKSRRVLQMTYTGTNITVKMKVHNPVICYNVLLNTLFLNDRKVMYSVSMGKSTRMFKFKHNVHRMISLDESVLVSLTGSYLTFRVHTDSHTLYFKELVSPEMTLFE